MNAASMPQKEMHWNRTRNLMIVHMVVWFIFSFVVHWFAPQLNKVSMFGWPLGFYMAAQGSLIVFVVQIFLFAKQQDRIDRECGMAEEE
jgi:putative solute:sodium symporter small subunit